MEDNTCKLILLGNGSVGKSSIIARFVKDGFTRVYKQTVGLDFFEKRLTLRGDLRLLCQVWDIGGQSINSPMLSKYISGADVIFLCYDVTDPDSFADVDDWHTLVLRTFQKMETKDLPKLHLIGNKIDLIQLRKITENMHAKCIVEKRMQGGEFMSAMNGDNVLKSFYRVAGQMAGITLSEYELAFTEKVIAATITDGGEEGRTAYADAIEKEDRENEANKLKGCACSMQ